MSLFPLLTMQWSKADDLAKQISMAILLEKIKPQTLTLHYFFNSKNISTLQTRQMSQTVFPLLSSIFKHATATNES